jgi:hypothetical protein
MSDQMKEVLLMKLSSAWKYVFLRWHDLREPQGLQLPKRLQKNDFERL